MQLQAETRNKVFAEKLETLLHRAYHLQEDFGSSIPTESVLADFGTSHFVVFIGRICSLGGPCLRRANLEYWLVMCRFNKTNTGHLKFTMIFPSVNLLKWVRTSSKGTQLNGFVHSATVFSSSLAESEGTLILPQVESFHRLRDDDATTISSDDSFFSAAEVGNFSVFINTDSSSTND